MDIRSIIDSEDTPPTRKPSLPISARQEHRASPIGFSNSPASAYDNRRDVRPPQPSPLQTSAHYESYFPAPSSQDSIQSPYQRTPSFGLNSGQYLPPQVPHHSPHHGQQVLQYSQRENSLPSGPQSGRSFGHSTPLSQTPTASTPGSASAYSNFPRPTSSHSIPTPNSANNSSSYLKDSPQAPLTQSRSFSQPQGAQHYISQPATPLGPPTSYGRPSLNTHRESPGQTRHRRSPSGGHYSQQEFVGPPAAGSGSPSSYRERPSSAQTPGTLRQREQSLSVSPKTRLPSLPSINRTGPLEGPLEPHLGRNGHETSKKLAEVGITGPDYSSKPKPFRQPSQSIGVSGLLNQESPVRSPESMHHASHNDSYPSNQNDSDIQFLGRNTLSQSFHPHSPPPQDSTSQQSHVISTQLPPAAQENPTSTAPSHRPSDSAPQHLPKARPASSFKMAALKASSNLIDAPLPPLKKPSGGSKRAKRPIHESSDAEASENSEAPISQPAKKKTRTEEPQDITSPAATQSEQPPAHPKRPKAPRISRWQDVPIFAQSIRGPQRTMELFQQNLTGTNRGAPITTPTPYAAASRPLNQTNGSSKSHVQAPNLSSLPNGVPALSNQAPPVNIGPLGPWEYTVTDTQPADEVTRIMADFLFPNVVLNNDVGVAPAGGGRGLGAVLEIEAKIGRLIDRNTNDRLQLPVMNECVISHADPNLRIAFESSMTEHQHRNLNQFLNKALVDSQGPKQGSAPPRKPRIPMTYKHTKEIDTFYEISQHGALQLPRAVASGLQLNPNARHKAKVRITTNEKTGEELAKIIKTRVADIDVYSPRTLFDWRVSVNVEMDFDIDMKDLVAVEKRDGKADRRKDRVSYKHLQYQIDLTQVTPAEPANKFDKEHELEIEVSSAEVRKQGLLVMNNQPNGYEDLIKGFVDNVRLLARFCKE